MSDPRQLVDAIRARFGERSAVTDPADIEPWLTDWRGRWHGAIADGQGDGAHLGGQEESLCVRDLDRGAEQSLASFARNDEDHPDIVLDLVQGGQ